MRQTIAALALGAVLSLLIACKPKDDAPPQRDAGPADGAATGAGKPLGTSDGDSPPPPSGGAASTSTPSARDPKSKATKPTPPSGGSSSQAGQSAQNGQSGQPPSLGSFLDQIAAALKMSAPAPGASPSGGSPGPGSTPPGPPVASGAPLSAESLASLRQLCLDTINRYRATIGRSALALDTAKSSCADTQAQADGQVGRAHANFGDCGESAQDECPRQGRGDFATTLTACLGRMWAEGPGGGHYENMASARYSKVSCGFTTVNGSIWMIQNFHR